MRRLYLLLLLIGAIVGLVAQQPAQAFAVPPGAIDMPAMSTSEMASMSRSDMAQMPDCMPLAGQDSTQTPCKCGVAGCAAMMASGVAFMPADQIAVLPVAASAAGTRPKGIFAALHGRTTVPELEPPSILI